MLAPLSGVFGRSGLKDARKSARRSIVKSCRGVQRERRVEGAIGESGAPCVAQNGAYSEGWSTAIEHS
jgi:hypothetical protein